MNIDNDTKRFIIHRLKWIGLFFGIGLVLGLLLPFPYDFISVLGVFFLVNFLRGRSILKRYGGIGGIKDMLGSLQSSTLAIINLITVTWFVENNAGNCMS